MLTPKTKWFFMKRTGQIVGLTIEIISSPNAVGCICEKEKAMPLR
jgi:hypothetical protein